MAAHTQGHQRRIARFNPHPLAKRLEVGMRGLVLPFLAAAHARQSGDQMAQLFTAKCHSVDGQSEAFVSRATASTDLSSTVQACDGKSKDQLFKFFHWNTYITRHLFFCYAFVS